MSYYSHPHHGEQMVYPVPSSVDYYPQSYSVPHTGYYQYPLQPYATAQEDYMTTHQQESHSYQGMPTASRNQQFSGTRNDEQFTDPSNMLDERTGYHHNSFQGRKYSRGRGSRGRGHSSHRNGSRSQNSDRMAPGRPYTLDEQSDQNNYEHKAQINNSWSHRGQPAKCYRGQRHGQKTKYRASAEDERANYVSHEGESSLNPENPQQYHSKEVRPKHRTRRTETDSRRASKETSISLTEQTKSQVNSASPSPDTDENKISAATKSKPGKTVENHPGSKSKTYQHSKRDKRSGGAVFEMTPYEKRAAEQAIKSVQDKDSRGKRQANREKIRHSKTGKRNKDSRENQRGMLIEEITRGSYECMVCCDAVRREAAVWSCQACFHIFHIHCIKRWARSSSAAATEAGSGGWRCPGCQNISKQVPSQYRCYCQKTKDPVYDRFETPHSCGQVCGKNRGGLCTHNCTLLCHPGPCPPCHASVKQSCQCGKTTQTVPCIQATSVKCEKICEKTLNCGKHECQQVCHSGSCEPCDKVIAQDCYCGRDKRELVCGSKESFQSSYTCKATCNRTLACKNHVCEAECHPGDCQPCSLLPDLVLSCPCGKTAVSELQTTERTSCMDAVPTCNETCKKPLRCGPKDKPHLCASVCHVGACSPCEGKSQVKCRCGAVTQTLPCVEIIKYSTENPMLCEGRCNKKLSCGSHRCSKKCCVDKEHVCHQICGRKLSCGLHRCEEVCHRGNCPRCWNVSFEELYCECGAEVMYPPIPCGTKPPECSQPCPRRHECDHRVSHPCHSEEKCPPCVQLTEKWCHGKHELRKNIRCHVTEVSCGLPCGKILPCEQHKCLTTCHKGDCLAEGTSCRQKCEKKRESCGHPCGAVCHAGQDCPETSCKTPVEVRCECGNRMETQPCHLFWSAPQQHHNLTTSVLAMKIADAQDGQVCDISSLTKRSTSANIRRLECNSDCAQIERNKRIAVALQIQNPELSSRLGPPAYNQFLKDYARQNASFVASVEGSLRDLVHNAQSGKQPRRSHAFKPMKNEHRRVVHELAEYYGCETLSYDEEPNKNVVATASKGKCWQPTVSLTALIQRELHPKAPTPIPLNSNMEKLKNEADAAKQSTSLLGANSAWGKTSANRSSVTKSDGWSHIPLRNSRRETPKPPSSETVIDYFDVTD